MTQPNNQRQQQQQPVPQNVTNQNRGNNVPDSDTPLPHPPRTAHSVTLSMLSMDHISEEDQDSEHSIVPHLNLPHVGHRDDPHHPHQQNAPASSDANVDYQQNQLQPATHSFSDTDSEQDSSSTSYTVQNTIVGTMPKNAPVSFFRRKSTVRKRRKSTAADKISAAARVLRDEYIDTFDGHFITNAVASMVDSNGISTKKENKESTTNTGRESPNKPTTIYTEPDTITHNGLTLGGKTFYLFDPNFFLRKILFYIVSSTLFSGIIYLIIVANVVIMVFLPPVARRDMLEYQSRYETITVFDRIFLSIYTAELLLHICVFGFLTHKHAYLRSSWWHIFEFFIVIAGWSSVAFNYYVRVSVLSGFRIMKGLMNLKFLSELRAILQALTQSVFKLVNALTLLLFLFLLFGIMGIEFYQNSYTRRCLYEGQEALGVPMYCDGGKGLGFTCPGDMTCETGLENPNFGVTHFDNMWNAFLTMFQITTLTGWTDLLYPLMQSEQPLASTMYFVFLIGLVSFIVIKLFMAIISSLFSKYRGLDVLIQKQTKKKKLTMEKRSELARSKLGRIGLFGENEGGDDSFLAALGLEPTGDAPANDGTEDKKKSAHQTLQPIDQMQALGEEEKTLPNDDTAAGKTTNPPPQEAAHHKKQSSDVNAINKILDEEDLQSDQDSTEESDDIAPYVYENPIEKFFYTTVTRIKSFLLRRYQAIRMPEPVANFFVFRMIFGLKRNITRMTHSRYFEYASLFISMSNLIVQATERNPNYMPEWHKLMLNVMAFIYFGIYVVEISIRFIGSHSLLEYFSDQFNILDIFVILLQFIGIIGYFIIGEAAYVHKFGFLRSLRVLCCLQYQSTFKRLQSLLKSSLKSVFPTLRTLVWIFFSLSIFTIIGFHMYADKLKMESGKSARYNFDDLAHGWLSAFSIMTSDNWYDALYRSMDPSKPDVFTVSYQWFSPLFFLSLYIFSAYVLLNLITAVVLENFEITDEERQSHEKKLKKRSESTMSFWQRKQRRIKPDQNQEFSGIHGGENDSPDSITHSNNGTSTITAANDAPPADAICCLIPRSNPVRRVVRSIVNSYHFENFMSVVIILCTVNMAFTSPSEAYTDFVRNPKLNLVVSAVEWVMLGIFTLELILKVFSNGLFFSADGTAYFENAWNIFDFFLLMIMYFTTIGQYFLPPILISLKILIALRPFRVLKRIPGLGNLLSSLWSSIPSMLNVIVASFFIMLLFGVAGVTMFAGKFHRCNADLHYTEGIEECTGYYRNDLGIMTHRVWMQPRTSFDHIGWAMFTLVEVMSLSAWTPIMYRAMDITSLNMQPGRDRFVYYGFYFIFYIIIGSFFVVNLCIGVIIDSINRERGIAFYTDIQQHYLIAQQEIAKLRQKKLQKVPKHVVRRSLWKFTESRFFRFVMVLVVIVNVGIICTTHRGQARWWEISLDGANLLFTIIYCLEAALKIFVYRLEYFKNSWCLFELFLAVGSAISIVADIGTFFISFGSNVELAVNFAGRTFRILRMFRLIPHFEGLKKLTSTLVHSLTSIFNTLLLLFTILYVYTIGAMLFFGNIRFQEGLNVNANFRSFGRTLLTLFRVATLDNWNIILNDTILVAPRCTSEEGFNDCGSYFSYIYWVSFYVIGSYLLLNLVIAVILDSFSSSYIESDGKFIVQEEDMECFRDVWKDFDKSGLGFIDIDKLPALMSALRKAGSRIVWNIDENYDMYRIFEYELLHRLEVYVPEHQSFLTKLQNFSLAKFFDLFSPQILMDPTRYVSFRDTLFLLARFCAPKVCLRFDERKERERALKKAMVAVSVHRIERAYWRYKRYGNAVGGIKNPKHTFNNFRDMMMHAKQVIAAEDAELARLKAIQQQQVGLQQQDGTPTNGTQQWDANQQQFAAAAPPPGVPPLTGTSWTQPGAQ